MENQNDFFSKNQKQLLSIATWAKYLAWATLIVYVFLTGAKIIELQAGYDRYQILWETLESSGTVYTLEGNWSFTAAVILDLITVALKGFTYFIMLNGLSLGLNMIVETKLNN